MLVLTHARILPGHPVPAPDLLDEQPQVSGKRAGLLTAFPRTKRHETWLRGAWPTDPNGVAQFTSKFHLQFSAHYQHPPYPQRSSQATTQAEQSMSTLRSFPVGQPFLMAPLSPASYCTRGNSSSKMILMCRSTRSVWFYRSPLRLLPKCT